MIFYLLKNYSTPRVERADRTYLSTNRATITYMRILPIYDRIGPIYDRRNSVYLRNFLLSRRKTYGEYINQTQYYIINYEDQDAYKCVLINDNGEVISEPHAFSVEFDPENPGFTWYTQYSFATMHGICVQTDDGKVWWYNRNA